MSRRHVRLLAAAAVLPACGIDARGSLVEPGSAGAESVDVPAGPSGVADVAPAPGAANGGDAASASDAAVGAGGAVDAAPGVSLTWTRAIAPASVDLTGEGPLDWAHWGANGTSPNRKAGVTALISDYSNTGSPSISPSSNNPSSFAWQDGTPTTTESGTTSHVYFKGEPNVTVTLTVAAAAAQRSASFYLCLNRTRARFEVDFSDGSVAPSSEELEKNDGAMGVRYDVAFRTPAANARLRVRWTMLTVVDPQNSTVRISAVAVRN